MKAPLEWLKDYVPVRLTPQALAERLTMAGLEVMGIEGDGVETVLDFEITPNRADCLSLIGIAREIAAVNGQRLTLPRAEAGRPVGSASRRRRGSRVAAARTASAPRPVIRIEDRQGCARYIGRLIEGVRIGPSPAWMQRRLLACGARPINNVVDITNYVLLEYGQPLHAFDFARLAGGAILVRRARVGERITTLDEVERALSSETLVIADASRPVAVAGVMGGMGSEVTRKTSMVLLESALFDPVTVRRAARRLGLSSESSYRFERGVDPAGVETASARAAALIEELAGGRQTAVVDVGTKPPPRAAITLEPQRLTRWLGMRVEPQTIKAALVQRSCRVASSGASPTLRVTPPSFRHDLVRDVDLYEEVARAVGYDRVPITMPVAALAAASPDAQVTGALTETAGSTVTYAHAQSLRCLCAGLGLTEVITWSLVAEPELARCGFAASAVHLANPISQDHAVLRPSLLVGMLRAVRHNLTQGAAGVRAFEVGGVVPAGERAVTPPWRGTPRYAAERLQLGLILSGIWLQDWASTQRCDFFRLKGLIQALTERLCPGAMTLQETSLPWAEPGQGTEIRLDGRSVGWAGEVSPRITEAWDVEQGVWFAELSVEALLRAKRPTTAVRVPPVVPPVKRDLSVLVGAETPFEAVDRAIHDVGGALAGRVALIDRYTGSRIPAGNVGLTFSIEYRDPSRTLTAAEVDAVHQRIGQTLVSRLGAVLR